eukprot:EG_transcript_17867
MGRANSIGIAAVRPSAALSSAWNSTGGAAHRTHHTAHRGSTVTDSGPAASPSPHGGNPPEQRRSTPAKVQGPQWPKVVGVSFSCGGVALAPPGPEPAGGASVSGAANFRITCSTNLSWYCGGGMMEQP